MIEIIRENVPNNALPLSPSQTSSILSETTNDERFLVISSPSPARALDIKARYGQLLSNWRKFKHIIPFAILSASFFELICFMLSDAPIHRLFRFEPNNPLQVWRYISYMFVHDDYFHLLLNITMQLLFAYFLEAKHGPFRILIIYFVGGGVTGALGAACFHPDLIIGASGGVYALLLTHLSNVLVNFDVISYKMWRLICIAIIVCCDLFVYNLMMQLRKNEEPLISWAAHVFGGLGGLLLGLVLLKRQQFAESHDAKSNYLRKSLLFWCGCLIYPILMLVLVIINMQIKKCTPANIIRTKYIYFC